MSEPGGEGAGSEACTYAHRRLGRGPGGRCCPSRMLQMASSQKRHATPEVGRPAQGVPGSRGQDGAGQDVLLYPQQPHLE